MTMLAADPPLTVLLGLPFHDLTLDETLDYCSHTMAGHACRYLVTANVDFTTQAYHDPDLRKIVFFADRVVCDGMPLVWLSRIFGHPLRERVAGSDMVPKLLEICGKNQLPVYFFGSDADTLREAKEIVESRYPGLRVAGYDSPAIGAVVEWDNDALCAKMRASGAKLLLVCLGCPKQERWIFAHHHETAIPLAIGVGASLDFITGKQKRAPRWMQKTGLEWFWRMTSNPARLASRYTNNFSFLIKAALRQWMAQQRREAIAATLPPPPPPKDLAVTHLSWSGDLCGLTPANAPQPESIHRHILLDTSEVTFIDGAGLGILAQLVRNCRHSGHSLIVTRPSRAFRDGVASVKMDSLFPMVDDEQDALAQLAQRNDDHQPQTTSHDHVVRISFHGALDALYHDKMIAVLDATMANHPNLKSLVIDLSNVDFIDSRAVGGLIRTWKTLTASGGNMFLANATPAVRDIIRLLRLDKLLLEWKEESP